MPDTSVFTPEDEMYMRMAIAEAEKGAAILEVPVGAVIVKDGVVIGRGHNRKEVERCATSHAEMAAIADASRTLGDWRLNGCTMYVTVEPCLMCSGALLHSRLDEVVFGVTEPKFGGVLTKAQLLDIPTMNHRTAYRHGLLSDEISALLKSFFRTLREQKGGGQ